VIVGMGVYPPWKTTLDFKRSTVAIKQTERIGYAPIFAPPELPSDSRSGMYGDFSRLGIQWGRAALVTVGLVYTLPGKKKQTNVIPRHETQMDA